MSRVTKKVRNRKSQIHKSTFTHDNDFAILTAIHVMFIIIYRTLHGRDQRKKCTLNFMKYTLGQTVLYFPQRVSQRVLYCNKALFLGNKAQLPTCLNAG